MLEKEIERWLGQQVQKLGGLWLKFTSPGHSGVPDRILILKGHVFFVEMKGEKGRMSPVQTITFGLMSKAGVSIHVVYGKNGAQEFLAHLKNPPGLLLLTDDIDPGIYEWR